MALDANILGQALYNAREAFNNRTMDDLMTQYGTLDALRLAIADADAQAIVNHITTSAVVMPTLLVAPNGAVTGTGTIT